MPDSRYLPPGRTPEEVLATQLARLRRELADLRSTIVARPPNKLPVYTSVGRPSAATLGEGAGIYDSTLNKPIWSDGAVWRDATGTAV